MKLLNALILSLLSATALAEQSCEELKKSVEIGRVTSASISQDLAKHRQIIEESSYAIAYLEDKINNSESCLANDDYTKKLLIDEIKKKGVSEKKISTEEKSLEISFRVNANIEKRYKAKCL